MTDTTNYRQERVERLLQELRHEVTRGMMDGEINETLEFAFIIPVSKAIPNGIVQCEFKTRPMPEYYGFSTSPDLMQPRLRVVGEGKRE